MITSERPKVGIRVLLVEDDAAICDLFERYFESLGVVLHVATDGPSALRHLEGFAPDVALVDLALPRLDGCTVIEAFRAGPGWEKVAILAYTGSDGDADRDRALRAGADRVIVKPRPPTHVANEMLAVICERRLRLRRTTGN